MVHLFSGTWKMFVLKLKPFTLQDNSVLYFHDVLFLHLINICIVCTDFICLILWLQQNKTKINLLWRKFHKRGIHWVSVLYVESSLCRCSYLLDHELSFQDPNICLNPTHPLCKSLQSQLHSAEDWAWRRTQHAEITLISAKIQIRIMLMIQHR